MVIEFEEAFGADRVFVPDELDLSLFCFKNRLMYLADLVFSMGCNKLLVPTPF